MSGRLERRRAPEPKYHELYNQPCDKWADVNWWRYGAERTWKTLRSCSALNELRATADPVDELAEALERGRLKWEVSDRGVERVYWVRRAADLEPLKL